MERKPVCLWIMDNYYGTNKPIILRQFYEFAILAGGGATSKQGG